MGTQSYWSFRCFQIGYGNFGRTLAKIMGVLTTDRRVVMKQSFWIKKRGGMLILSTPGIWLELPTVVAVLIPAAEKQGSCDLMQYFAGAGWVRVKGGARTGRNYYSLC